jgi:hypothetical protein
MVTAHEISMRLNIAAKRNRLRTVSLTEIVFIIIINFPIMKVVIKGIRMII